METTLDRNTSYAPTNEINGGVASYSSQGTDWMIQKRRENAYQKMYSRCNGPYKIVEEGEHVKGGAATPVGGVMFYNNQHEWKIKFECEKRNL